MEEILNYFDELHFTESRFGVPVVSEGALIIPVKGLFLMRGHPLLPRTPGPVNGHMIFEGVVSSSKILVEYIGDPRNPSGFKEPRQEHDGPFMIATGDGYREFRFEGFLETPAAWIDRWVVKAREFALRLEGGNG